MMRQEASSVCASLSYAERDALKAATLQERSHRNHTIHVSFDEAGPEQRRALRERLRPRAKIERKISELCRRHGLRQARYRGQRKTELQAVLTATMVNIKRLTLLASMDVEQGERIRPALAA